MIDPETGRFLDVNERACVARGYTREEYLGSRSRDRLRRRAAWETRDELGAWVPVFESEHRRKDGSLFPVEVNATYISLERDYVLAVVRDITERRGHEAPAERRVEGTTDAIYVKDQGRYLMINAAGAALGSGAGCRDDRACSPRALTDACAPDRRGTERA